MWVWTTIISNFNFHQISCNLKKKNTVYIFLLNAIISRNHIIDLVPSRTYLSEQSRCGENAWLLRGLCLPRINICSVKMDRLPLSMKKLTVTCWRCWPKVTVHFTKWFFFLFVTQRRSPEKYRNCYYRNHVDLICSH